MNHNQQYTEASKKIRVSSGVVFLASLLALVLLAACGAGSPTTAPSGSPTFLPNQTPGATATKSPPVSPAVTPTTLPTQTPSATTAISPTQTPVRDPGPGPHESDEGLLLGQETGESVYEGGRCGPDAPVKTFDVAAINIEISLNRYLDFDPIGRMYVLEQDLERARLEESQNRAARLDQADPGVSVGLQGDAIQPLTLRVNQGDCLLVTLRNALANGEAASLHIHGSSLHMAESGTPAVATNLKTIALSGASVTYEWMVEADQPEGTHYFHSHGDQREQTSHGLFGAVIVEPGGSLHLDPLTGAEMTSGWSAVIRDSTGSDFREFAIYYHEIGNEAFTIQNKAGATGFGFRKKAVNFVDDLTGAYKPGGRAMNYRSEPFLNRMKLQQDTVGKFDPSQAYSSYTFGDPATPIARSYLGDPVKQRVIHGGSEVFHVHHVHGGAIRWPRQPGMEPTNFDTGLNKFPDLLPQASSRIDSQAVGPAENYDVENECGSGGCQQSVGDFLTHCHVAHHYVAGKWMIWRVQNTLQDGIVSQDGLPPLIELPDREGLLASAVTSEDLVDTEVDWKGRTFDINKENLAQWVEAQLPPSGKPIGYDASVLDWSKEGDLYLNEPDTQLEWSYFRSPDPGQRPPLYFNPITGKLAYPYLRPHLGKRPPFAPNHGPAPFLEPLRQGTDPPKPGENGPWSLCPAGTKQKEFAIHAINLPITLNRKANLVDPVGQLYVLKEQENYVRADNRLKVPLAIRANAGKDCVDVVFKSELEDTGENNFFSKVNIHIHFVQFDIQGSDGVNTGFNYETSIRPFTEEGETLSAATKAGDVSVSLGRADRFQPGALVGVGMDQDRTFEIRRIRSIDGNAVSFGEPLKFNHRQREIVSTEFVRYRWYPDAQFGTAYFHDHVSGLTSWRHGLFGALISEPPDATYHDPKTGLEVASGALVDIRTDKPVSVDLTGSFREAVMFIQDDNPLTNVGRSSGSSLNLRVEPLANRGEDPSRFFDSSAHGDPETPLIQAYLGDPVVIRGLVAATNDVHTLHVDGHWFRLEPFSETSPPVNNVHIGISERYDLTISGSGGPQNMPSDYLYYSGRSFKLEEGSWGILRVLADVDKNILQNLPGREKLPTPASSVCPADSPVREFAVSAVDVPLPMLGGTKGKIFVLDHQKDAVLSGAAEPQPLVLSVNVGDCVSISLTNDTRDGPVSFHADMLAYDPTDSMGINAGFNNAEIAASAGQTVPVGATRPYTFFAHPEIGETLAMVQEWGNVLENPGLGLYGAIVVGPKGATYTDPVTGEEALSNSAWRVDVHPATGPSYRCFTLFFQDEDEIIGTHIMPYTEAVEGVVAINYRFAPLAPRIGAGKEPFQAFDSEIHADPATPVMEAFAGDPVKVHVLAPFSEQAHVFTIEGHQWPMEPGRAGTDMLDSVQLGGLDALTLVLDGGSGGRSGLPGDYIYGDHREAYREAGLWGLFRVHPSGQQETGLLPLPGS